MVSINTNLSSIRAQSSLTKSTNSLNQAIERMTTGFKINHASDNAANYSISQNVSSKLSSLEVAEENASMGLDMVQTASSSLDQISDLTIRLRTLAEQAQNGTYGTTSLTAINKEAEAIVSEINRIRANTEYNNQSIFSASSRITGFRDSQGREYTLEDGLFMNSLSAYTVSPSGTVYISPGETSAPINTTSPYATTSPGVTTTPTGTLASPAPVASRQYISTKQDLLNISLMSNISNTVFFLTNDIDMSGETWTAPSPSINGAPVTYNIDGQGHTISNIKCDSNAGIFGNAYVLVANTGFENCVFTHPSSTELLPTDPSTSPVVSPSPTYSSSSDVYLMGNNTQLCNCYIKGVSSDNSFDRINYSSNGTYIIDCDSLIGYSSCYIADEYMYGSGDGGGGSPPGFTFQVGIDGDESSRITFSAPLDVGSLDNLISSGLESSDSLATIDAFLAVVNSRQTELGAVENRLESVLESIGVNIVNLTSTRSTLRDADIAETSSQYIRSQILQQASATLLATANQSPALVLRLLQGL